ncbi:hypothetical protein SAMN05444920_102336 [Nonomuraea solani]|uniref:Uncharacterized protein n=1 Tax=Nonomuraea solani TaxID=1144553 RepID=A0A1H5YL73_9ACTN|nr:hypothetical protein [Nonomuraea solani]SEG24828.1 hypothetical protein SAMN05444920_102336 [Nonomuraea solani]
MEWNAIVGHGIGYGLVISLLFTIALLAGFAVSRDFLLGDYPPAIQERYGKPRSARGGKVAIWVGILFWGVCFLPLLTAAVLDLRASIGHDLGFWRAAACAAIAFATMTLFDLVVLDWLILAGLRPALMVLPGTEGMKEYRDLCFHAVEALKGSPLILVVGLVAGGLTTAAEAIV